jgi:ubiquinone/menaquinone biosynthesis C-methylase UbiE
VIASPGPHAAIVSIMPISYTLAEPRRCRRRHHTMSTTDLARPRFARMYVKAAKSAEQRGATEHRRRLLEGLSGSVLELGAGHGLNFPHYPSAVTEVLAIEPEPTLRAHATEAAASSPIPIRVLGGVADELPREDESVDAAVASLVLCSVPDQDRALAELRRVLRAGGELRFYEHVIPDRQPKRLLLQAADHSGLWPRIAGGCHPARDTQAAIERAGFEVHSSERLMFAAAWFEPAIPYLLGTARRPG